MISKNIFTIKLIVIKKGGLVRRQNIVIGIRQFKKYRILMNRSSSKQKYQSQTSGLIATLQVLGKSMTVKAPMPCPASTLKELIGLEVQKMNPKIAYYQTVNNDWTTDYKIQIGSGWIRNNIQLRAVMRKRSDEVETGMEAYTVAKCIGVGGFSKVYLARDKTDGTFYAAKFTQKAKIQDKKDLILNQKKINENIAFPFLVHMKDFIQTDEYYIMILEYCPGGQLFNLQRRVIRFQEEDAKKYFLEVFLAIQYLHERGIIYRDLKPENIMIDLKGHLKIADFGLAKETKERRYSFCGSLEYMSPEILARIGHSFEVDHYCLGALLYQMLVGCPPFYEPNSPENQTKTRIMYQEVQFPSDFQLSEGVKDLIRQLLVKDPKKRLGHHGGTKQIKCHPWIGWLKRQQWLSRKFQMPYPVNLDQFNFDCRDITASANRLLDNINTQCQIRKRQSIKTRAICMKKSEKVLSPYRHNRQSFNQAPKKSYSTDKLILKGSTESMTKDRKPFRSKSKQTLKTLKACYLSNQKLSLSKYLRYPTEIGDIKGKKKTLADRKSFFKGNGDTKENDPQRQRNMKKKRPKEELIFMQIKRH